jgi:hypothetical protein
MNVFLSWSGARGRLLAEGLNEWLPKLRRAWRPWVSSRQKRGTDWRAALFEHINAADAGVLCLTSDSVAAKWLAFEAGMLSRRASAPIAVYGLDLASDELSGTPLARFPVFSATSAGTRGLLQILNAALPEPADERELDELISTAWPGLELHFGNVPSLEVKPFKLFVMLAGLVARYDFEVPTDRPWSDVLGAIQHALSEQYGVIDADLSDLEYFDLDDKSWIPVPRRLSAVKTSRLVAVHPEKMQEFNGSKGDAEVMINFHLDQHPREVRADALMRRDLQDLVREQEAYREKHGAYALGLETLEFFTATDIAIEILEATESGWCAVGTHKDLRWHLGIRSGTTQRFADEANATVFPV